METQLIKFLSDYVTPQRWELFQKVIKDRTRHLTVGLEDIYQSHNASAVLRTCDCFGIQDVHIIENRNAYTVNPDVALGASKWLSLHYYKQGDFNTTACIEKLKSAGYRIVATTPHKKGVLLDDFNVAKGKFALFFGTEMHGLTDNMLAIADEFIMIPMYGFTESFNISVSAAIILHHLSLKIRKSNIQWQLSPGEKEQILLHWLRSTIKKSELLENKFLSNQTQENSK
jgi:tRNA (guanosine-2'-O-)-methyltransferase